MARLTFTLELPGVSVARLRAFHASPLALVALSPPGTLERVTGDTGGLHEGQRITLHLRKFGLRIRWDAVNEAVTESGFTDRMLRGPFKAWTHQHRFEPTEAGSRLVDELEFLPPLWPLSFGAMPWLRADLQRLFRYRHEATARALGVQVRFDKTPSSQDN